MPSHHPSYVLDVQGDHFAIDMCLKRLCSLFQVNSSGGPVEVLDLQDDTANVADEAVAALKTSKVIFLAYPRS